MLRPILLVCLLAWTSVHAQQVKIGVVLPLTGPFAILGSDAYETLKFKLSGLQTVVLDSSGRPELAAENVRRLVHADKVSLIIGGVTAGEIGAISRVNAGIPVMGLTSSLPPELTQAAKAARVTTFAQREQQVRVLPDALPRQGKYVVASSPFYAGKAGDLARPVSDRVIERQLSLNVGQRENLTALARSANSRDAVVTSVMDPLSAASLLREVGESGGKAVIVSPPLPSRLAGIAGDLVAQWARSTQPTASSWEQLVARNPLFDRDSGTLQLDWSVATRGLRLVQSTVTGGKPCKCSSRDGKVTRSDTCNDPPEKCKVEEKEDDCSCKCS